MGLSRTILFSGVARYQGSLQTDRVGHGLGHRATNFYCRYFQCLFWPAGEDTFGWYSISIVFVCGTGSLDIFFLWSKSIIEQSGRQCEPNYQSVFSQAGGSNCFHCCWHCGFSVGVRGADRDDGVLPCSSDDEHHVLAPILLIDSRHLTRGRPVALRVERQIPRCASDTSVSGATLDVRNPNRISQQPAARFLEKYLRPESNGWRRGGVSLGAAGSKESARHYGLCFGSNRCTVVNGWRYVFQTYGKNVC